MRCRFHGARRLLFSRRLCVPFGKTRPTPGVPHVISVGTPLCLPEPVRVYQCLDLACFTGHIPACHEANMVGQHVKHIRRSALNENRSVMAGMGDDDLEVSAS